MHDNSGKETNLPMVWLGSAVGCAGRKTWHCRKCEISCAAELSCSSRCRAAPPFWPLLWDCQRKIPVGDSSGRFEHLQFWALLSAPLSTCQLLISQSQLVLSLWICSGYDSPEQLCGTKKTAEKGEGDFSRNSLVLHDKLRTLLCKFWLKLVNFFSSFKFEPTQMSCFI